MPEAAAGPAAAAGPEPAVAGTEAAENTAEDAAAPSQPAVAAEKPVNDNTDQVTDGTRTDVGADMEAQRASAEISDNFAAFLKQHTMATVMDMSVKEAQNLLRSIGLPSIGSKPDLQQYLLTALYVGQCGDDVLDITEASCTDELESTADNRKKDLPNVTLLHELQIYAGKFSNSNTEQKQKLIEKVISGCD